MKRVALLLRKDLLVLRRSPLLPAILVAYPLAIAVLVGLVASYGSSKPRVALVDEDNLPATVVLGGHRFHVDRTIREVSKNVKLVRLDADEAGRQLRDGRVVAVVTVPPGFVSTLRGMVNSPQLKLELSLAFGVIIEIGGVTGGEPWRRLPLLAVGLVLAGGTLGALGALLGALAKEARSASLVAVLVVMPIVFLGLIPEEVVPLAGWLSDLLPFTHAVRFFRSALYDLSPWPELARETLWLLVLGGIFGVLARVGARRLLA